jgi:hypothetical protein
MTTLLIAIALLTTEKPPLYVFVDLNAERLAARAPSESR